MVPFHKPIKESLREELSAYDDITASLLSRRGVVSVADAERFLNPSYDLHTHNPMEILGMKKASVRLAKAITDGEHIAVWSDYDADGVPGAVIMHDFLKKVGAKFTNYIPHRNLEGYGVNVFGIEKLAADNVTLVITIDSGITDIISVERANELGMDVIVTDHHEPGEKLPDAFVVVDPKQKNETYPFRDLCGAALAWKLVVATLTHDFSGREKIHTGWEKWMLDMVAVATVADMVPLVGENRVLAKYGLFVLRKSSRAGLVAMCRTMCVNQRGLSEDDIAFMIAPRINAASRMGDPIDAFRLFATTDINEASLLAKKLESANRRRRSAAGAITRAVHTRIKQRGAKEDLPVVIAMGDSDWSPALLGLVASGITEEYGKPVFLWGRDATGAIKGSCRSEGFTDTFVLMSETKDTFVRCGGHAAAGGFVVRSDAVSFLEDNLVKTFSKIKNKNSKQDLFADIEISIKDVTMSFLANLERLAPFGEGNKKPALLLRNVEVVNVSEFGKNNEHIKMTIANGRGTLEAVSFFAKHAMRQRVKDLDKNTNITILVHLEKDTFLYKNTLRLRILKIA